MHGSCTMTDPILRKKVACTPHVAWLAPTCGLASTHGAAADSCVLNGCCEEGSKGSSVLPGPAAADVAAAATSGQPSLLL